MALTLTEEKRIAWKIQGIGPDPAHTLVIFKKAGTGKTVHKVLRPGEPLKLGLLQSADSYEAFAVSANRNLRHEFSRKYGAVGQTWTFTLHFDLHFEVSDAERLALCLVSEDPLQRLEKEVARLLSATARHLSWESMKREGEDFGRRLREAETTDGQGERKTNFQRLQSFAGDLGFELWNVEITRTLTEADVEEDLTKRRNERLKVVARSERDLEAERDQLEHERELLRNRLKLERDIVNAQGQQALQGMERLRMVLDGITKEGLRGLSQAVGGVRSFPAINDALLEIRTIQSSLMGLSSGASSVPALDAAGSPVLQVAEVRRPSDPLERLVTEAFQQMRALDGNPADKRRILAIILHLVAEAALGREGDENYLEGCRENLKQELYPLESALEEEQRDFLRRITDLEELRQELAWEA